MDLNPLQQAKRIISPLLPNFYTFGVCHCISRSGLIKIVLLLMIVHLLSLKSSNYSIPLDLLRDFLISKLEKKKKSICPFNAYKNLSSLMQEEKKKKKKVGFLL